MALTLLFVGIAISIITAMITGSSPGLGGRMMVGVIGIPVGLLISFVAGLIYLSEHLNWH
jgi:hypothetical protein